MILPENFSLEQLSDGWNLPLALKFDEHGNLYVGEKDGIIWRLEDGQKISPPLLDISDEVGGYGDHGLLGFELHPNFHENGYLYLYYVADRYHMLFEGTPEYDENASLNSQATIVRVTRFQADASTNYTTVDKSNRRYLIGEDFEDGIPVLHDVHAGGTIVYADDGTLLLGTGDGSTWEDYYVGDGPPFFGAHVTQALTDGIIEDYEDVGSFRAQLTNSLSGKILRIDAETGNGLSSNPWFDPANPRAPQSRVWSKGMRNPYRSILRKGTGSNDPDLGLPGSLYVGDVGDLSYEELNVVVRKGQNFGWPLYEGVYAHDTLAGISPLNETVPNDLYQEGDCDQPFHSFADLIKLPQVPDPVFTNPCNPSIGIPDEHTAVMTFPEIIFRHWRPDPDFDGGVYFPILQDNGQYDQVRITSPECPIPNPEADCAGNSTIPAGFYQNDQFPAEYHDNLFIADYVQGWIVAAEFDLNDKITELKPFFRDTSFISDVKISPVDGCLYFLDYQYGLKRICYGANLPPISMASASEYYGPSPLTVDFSSEGSRDPQEEAITFLWDFGNGNTSTEPNPSTTFTADDTGPQSYTVTLTVTDASDKSTSTELLISLNNTPPQVEITSPIDGYLFSSSGISIMPAQATVTDTEHSHAELSFKWQKKHIHNTHAHVEQVINQETGFIEADPAVCDADIHFYRIELEVTDAHGLIGKDAVEVFPDCESPKFVELSDFGAAQVENKIDLNWSTASEPELDYFEVYRVLTSGELDLVGTAAGENATGTPTNYLLSDNNPSRGINSYRLKMINTDGEAVYSAVQSVIFVDRNSILCYPNPATTEINIVIGTMGDEITVQLFNMDGRLMLQEDWFGEPPNVGSLKMDIKHLATGLYYYRVINDNQIEQGAIFLATE